jgi:hypothetical protein
VITAKGDLFPDMVAASKAELAKQLPADRVTATPETSFTGLDAFKKVVATDCDLVILAAPPFFRPAHLAAAVDAGKHVFMEKPVAVDPGGVRSVSATSELAAKKRRAIVAGTQRRHQVAESTLTAIMGRMSAYTGRAMSWDWVMNASKLDLTPPHLEFKALPPLEVAVPGRTELT